MARERLSPTGLRWPDGWPLPKRRGRGRAAVVAVFGVLCLLTGPLLTVDGSAFDPALTAAVVIFGLLCLATAPLLVLGGGRDAVHHDGTGVVFPFRRGLPGPTGAAFSLGVGASAGLLAVSVASGARGDPVLISIAVLLLGNAVILVFRRFTGRPHRTVTVTLTPSAVVVDQAAARYALPWQRIGELAGHSPNDVQLLIVLILDEAVPDLALRPLLHGSHPVLPAHMAKVDPALLWHALRYYHRVPQAREELAGRAGVTRIVQGDLRIPSDRHG